MMVTMAIVSFRCAFMLRFINDNDTESAFFRCTKQFPGYCMEQGNQAQKEQKEAIFQASFYSHDMGDGFGSTTRQAVNRNAGPLI